jgi:hypothetical protein
MSGASVPIPRPCPRREPPLDAVAGDDAQGGGHGGRFERIHAAAVGPGQRVGRAPLGAGTRHRDPVHLVQLGDEFDLDDRDRGGLDGQLERDRHEGHRDRPLDRGHRPAGHADRGCGEDRVLHEGVRQGLALEPLVVVTEGLEVTHGDARGGVHYDVCQPPPARDRGCARLARGRGECQGQQAQQSPRRGLVRRDATQDLGDDRVAVRRLVPWPSGLVPWSPGAAGAPRVLGFLAAMPRSCPSVRRRTPGRRTGRPPLSPAGCGDARGSSGSR